MRMAQNSMVYDSRCGWYRIPDSEDVGSDTEKAIYNNEYEFIAIVKDTKKYSMRKRMFSTTKYLHSL